MAIDKRKFAKKLKDKYSFENNTFRHVVKNEGKNRIEVEIGDSKQPDFKPQFKLMRWDNEVNLSFRLKDDGLEEEIVDTKADKIVWKKGKREAYFYDIDSSNEHPEGAYEFEIVLIEKPDTNVVEFSLNTKGLDFFYQPSLTEEYHDGFSDEFQKEIIVSASKIEDANNLGGDCLLCRPENVVGSYAVYSSEHRENYVGGKEYKVGKVGHIYRPQIEDDNGTKVWGELDIDTKNGILSVTIPQEFLDNAVYPVRHAAGLTFGFTSVGSTCAGTGNNSAQSSIYSPASSGTVTDINIATKSVCGTTAVNTKGVIVLNSTLTAITNGVSNAGALVSNAFVTLTFGTNPSVVGGTSYNLASVCDAAGRGIALDTTGASYISGAMNYATPTTLTNSFSGTRKYSIYATYTASASDPTPQRMLMGMGS